METVGIKALKAQLSEYVAKASQGEYVIITCRGKEIAELVPVSKERRAMKLLTDQGRVKWRGGKPAGLQGIKVKGKPIADTVLEERR